MCGNGILEPGEQCDDGNLINGDGCHSNCTYELIPGNGNGSLVSNQRACLLEWSVVNPHNLPGTDQSGRPNFMQTCTNNDPTCDFDLDPADHTCEFRVVVCLNNVDAQLPSCPPLGVTSPITLRAPNARRDPFNYGSVTNALQNLRDPRTGEVGRTLPIPPSSPTLCTAPFAVRVPLRGSTGQLPGRVSLRTVSHSAATSPRSVRDTDRVIFVCQP